MKNSSANNIPAYNDDSEIWNGIKIRDFVS